MPESQSGIRLRGCIVRFVSILHPLDDVFFPNFSTVIEIKVFLMLLGLGRSLQLCRKEKKRHENHQLIQSLKFSLIFTVFLDLLCNMLLELVFFF